MRKTVRRLYWLIIGLTIGLTFTWLFAGQSWAASLSLGGGQVNPHSYSGKYGLDKGWQFSASVEDDYYENDVYNVNVGILYVASHYKRRNNYGRQSRRSQDSHLVALYGKTYYHLTEHIRPFVMAGAGVNFMEGAKPSGLLGGGFNYVINRDWSLEGTFLYVWDNTKIYRMPTVSLRYEF